MKISESQQRTLDRLKSIMLGPLLDHFNDPKTVELMVNPDGQFYVEKLGRGIEYVCDIPADTTYSLITATSGFHDQIVNIDHPVCEGEFPLDGSRFEGLIPPIVAGPSFSLRKKAVAIFSLESYVESGVMSESQFEVIVKAVQEHKNIMVIGGTGSGKTTLLNAIIDQMTKQKEERVVIIEDTGELQCAAKNHVQMRATSNVPMTNLVKASLRYRPDRILVGEVRGPEALDLLDAWNTGHPGGLATLHANSAPLGLDRLKSLITRNPSAPSDIEKLIGECVNVVVAIMRYKGGRKIKEIIEVKGFDEVKKSYIYSQVA